MDMPLARLASVERMLKRRVTVEEAIEMVAPFDHPPKPKKRKGGGVPAKRPAWLPGDGPSARAIRELAAEMQPGDELWHYDSEPEDWRNLCGEMGFAVVRAGRVVSFDMLLMN
ncbi:hypothetical protein [Zavarzinella formosa]|uniref:hypothetical protein n=1 Tax=Zavarzinella formosa TaxID=360055 RepID=UPI0002F0A5FB|nr:hypothetical protein [Zavarzinella formosa]